MNNNQLSMT